MFFYRFEMFVIQKVVILKHAPSFKRLSPQNKYADMILEVDPESVQELITEHVVAIRSLWADAGLQQCYDRKREYQLSDSCK